AKEASPEIKQATELVKGLSSTFDEAIKGNVFELNKKTNEYEQRGALDSEDYKRAAPLIYMRTKRLKEELTRELAKRAKSYGGTDSQALDNEALLILKDLLTKPEYRLKLENGQPTGFINELPGNTAKFRIVKEGEGKRPTRQLAHLKIEDIATLKEDGLVDTHLDRLYNGKDAGFVSDIQALAEGRRPSQRTQDLAATLGVSTRELINNQMLLNSMGSLDAATGTFYRDEKLKQLRNVQPTDYRSTSSALQDYGVPPKAAGQLARLSQVNFTADDGRPGLPGISQTQRDVLNRIARPESGAWGYDAANEGSYDTAGTQPINPGTGTDKYGRPLTSMTVGEVLDLGAKGNIHAAGRYQFIHDTLKEQVGKHGVPLDAKFDESMQDYLTLAYMRQNPTAWVGINQHDPGAIGQMNEVAREPLPPAPWLGGTDPKVMMMDMQRSNPKQYNVIMNKASSANQVRAAIMAVYGNKAGLLSAGPRKVYTTGNLGWGSTGDHLDIKPVSPGKFLSNRSLGITRSELDQYVAVATANGLKPLSQAMQMTASDSDHRNRGSHGIDFAHNQPNREIFLTNGARVIENYLPQEAAAEGSHRLLIEVPGGKRYAFLHGTSQIRPTT
ncbi:MAG: efflux RND transporter permease subunit, partial [Gammaproteobacteria bacterium]|nr:efflux RND transporter permease subunit [Gammaproteobacteria bacterium]